MSSISWYDWITPSNPFAAIVLGLIVVSVAAFSYWYETRSLKETMIAFGIGVLIIFIGVYLLQLVGFYK